jgi:methylglutaconyl-CoA hydratase
VQGDFYAGGMGLVAACDIAVSIDTAWYCLSEVKIGLIPATISPYVLRAMGTRAAQRWFLTAERFTAAEAHRIGFVHEVVSADALDAKVAEIVRRDQREPGSGACMQDADRGGGRREIDDAGRRRQASPTSAPAKAERASSPSCKTQAN